MSRNDEKFSPLFIHGMMTFCVFLTFNVLALLYVDAVGSFYLIRSIWRVMAFGPSHRRYIMTRRLAWAVGLTIPTAIYGLTLMFPPSRREVPGQTYFWEFIGCHLILWALIPVWWVALLVASIPYRLLKQAWLAMKKSAEKHQQQAQSEKWQQDAREADVRAQAEAQKKAAAQKRRDDARATSEMFFRVHAPDIRDRFSEAAFQDFVKRYMGDERTPEEVEQRALQLQQMIQQHLAVLEPPPKFSTLEDVAAWYMAQKKQIESLAVGELFKKQHLMQLNMQYAELSEKILEKP